MPLDFGLPQTASRLERTLRNAQIGFFYYHPANVGDVADAGDGAERGWQWSGAHFGIAGIDGIAGRQRFLEAVSEVDRPDLNTIMQQTTPDCSRRCEFRLETSAGKVRYFNCEVYAESAIDNISAVIVGIVQEVTNQRHFEVELTKIAARNQMLLAAIDACPVSITVADALQPDIPLIYVNRAFSDITGYHADEVIGLNCRFLQGPATEPESVASMRQTIAGGAKCDVQVTNYRKDGSSFLNRFQLAPFHDHTTQVTAYIGLQSDVTIDAKRKDTENQRRKMEALGRMMGGVAHEINNMLQPVVLLGQDLVDQGLVMEVGKQHLDVVIDCTAKARHIIADLLAFSRPNPRRAELQDPKALLRDALRLIHQAVLPGIVLSVRVVGDPPPIAIDRTMFVQILLNLVSNAAAAVNGDGKVKIILDIISGPVSAEPVIRPIPFARLRVIDRGCGMDKVTLDRAFEPFFTTKPVGQGTGLGLPVVYGLVRELGGTITLDSEPNRGTTATILIPGTEN
jgi:PAS domain S-box-containing protein